MSVAIGMTTLVAVQLIARRRGMVFSDFAKILAIPTAIIATRFLLDAMNRILIHKNIARTYFPDVNPFT